MKRNFSQEQGDIFMKRFKYYKSNKPLPSLDNVINTGNCNKLISATSVHTSADVDARVNILGLQDLKSWKIFVFEKHPGLILIKDPFTSLGQRYWIKKCLQEYPRKPNKTNIDIERQIDDWWKDCHNGVECDRKLQKKLRWSTMGYHHNWDTKVYSEENKNNFPMDLAELCDVVASYLSYKTFRAEAAIVNYYHMGSTLSAHTDHSEVNLEAPLFSFSFGQSAIFLIGGRDKSIEPSAILLNSGDIMVMSEEARLCYHAVPKILPAATQPWNREDNLKSVVQNGGTLKFVDAELIVSEMESNIDNECWSMFNMYVQESRININVRQVLKRDQKKLYKHNNNNI